MSDSLKLKKGISKPFSMVVVSEDSNYTAIDIYGKRNAHLGILSIHIKNGDIYINSFKNYDKYHDFMDELKKENGWI